MTLTVLAVGVVGLTIWEMWHSRSMTTIREFAVAAVGAVAALAFFLYGQHRDETRLFLDLFEKFNARFDKLNDPLNVIVETLKHEPNAVLTQADRQCLYDYFNLCAEEYLFVQSGYLDREVWESWCRGMQTFAAVPAIGKLWKAELATGSYYGFTLGELGEGSDGRAQA